MGRETDRQTERERERERVDFVKIDKMIKIAGKFYKSDTYNGFSSNILFVSS